MLAAMPFDDEADAVHLTGTAYGTDYGLPAAVWTENAARLQGLTKAVKAGNVFMNCCDAGGGVELPFGGTKRSDPGREKGCWRWRISARPRLRCSTTAKSLAAFYPPAWRSAAACARAAAQAWRLGMTATMTL